MDIKLINSIIENCIRCYKNDPTQTTLKDCKDVIKIELRFKKRFKA